jgi:hypothetical protein
VLLEGDGWWSEPDIGEWLWVGDYVWGTSDRAGRLPLAASADIGGARWIVIGDNSLFINSQIVADPRPILTLLGMATLWPAVFRDFFLATVALVLSLFTFGAKKSFIGLAASVATTFIIAGLMPVDRGLKKWRDFYVGEAGFDDRNFNQMIVDHPDLTIGKRLVRMRHAANGEVKLELGKTVLFGLVDQVATFDGVKLSNCRRMGTLKTAEGPFLMDAQACQVTGPAQILIGTPEGAAVIKIVSSGKEAIVVLDTAFLSKTAPDTNATWLLEQ